MSILPSWLVSSINTTYLPANPMCPIPTILPLFVAMVGAHNMTNGVDLGDIVISIQYLMKQHQQVGVWVAKIRCRFACPFWRMLGDPRSPR